MSCIYLCLALLGLFSCTGHSTPSEFDPLRWQSDQKGCAGGRLQLANSIILHKGEWKGLDDDVLIDLLGKPEKSFYYERNAKAFSYFIESGSQCAGSSVKTEGRRLTAEINAIGYVNIIRIER